jgi:YD repeat-containing protein
MLSLMDWEDRQFPGLSGEYRLSYDYNLVGQIKTIIDPTNSAINYARDSAGRVTGVTGTPYGTGLDRAYFYTANFDNELMKDCPKLK